MIFETFAAGGCRSYLVGCESSRAAILIDPELSLVDRYLGSAAQHGVRIHYVVDTHTHADHFSAARELARTLDAPLVMNRLSPAPFADMRLDDGDMLIVGELRLKAMHTPGHTRDSMCLVMDDRVFPAHEYKGREATTIGDEIANNPRLAKTERAAFVEMMEHLDLAAPTHLTEALRTNMSGGKSVDQLLHEAAAKVPFMSLTELNARLGDNSRDLVVLDIREKDAFAGGHIPGAKHLPRGQLELRVNDELPDPTVRILTCCEFGKISTLAAATLRELGFGRAAALDGGMKAWREAGLPLEM